MHNNQYYKNAALSVLRGNWKPSVIATLIYMAIAFVLSGAVAIDPESVAFASFSNLLTILILGPLGIGFYNAFKVLLRKQSDDVTNNMFNIGFGNYKRNLLGILLMYIYIILWTLLLIIPGIIKSFSYAMLPYILHDNPELSVKDALRKSEIMMKGHKFDLFCLVLSFLGWIILAIFTFGIGYLWLIPYMYCSMAAFYDDIKNGNPAVAA